MTGPATWTQPAVHYLREHAIDPEVAAKLGVREAGGAIIFPIARPDGSTFERRRPLRPGPAKTTQPAGEPLRLWWPQGRPEAGDLVIVLEGESDLLAALSARSYGPHIPGVTDMPVAAVPGTGYPVDRLVEELAGFGVRQALLALDADDAGRAYGDRAVAALRSAGVQPAPVELPDGHDLSDALSELGSAPERGDWLANLLADAGCAAEPLLPGRAVEGETEGQEVQDRLGSSPTTVAPAGSTLTAFTDIVAKPIEWLWRHRVALGKITALSGAPKIGKGLFYTDLIARVTRGDLDGDVSGPGNVILVTTEDEPGDTLKPRLMAAGADLSRVSFFQMGTKDDPVPFRVPQDSEELGRRVAEKRATLVVIDPLVEFIDGKVDSHKSHPVRQAIATLNGIVREHRCALVVIFHLNKSASTDPLLRHEGSAAFTQVVRGGLMLGRDPEDPDGDLGNQRVLAVSATNLAPMVRSLTYRIETRVVDGDTGTPIETARMVTIGESDASSHDLLRGRDDEAALERDNAADFLTAELADGPRPVKEVKTAALDAGIAWRTIERAKARLDVETSRVGGAGAAGHWEWWLRPPRGSGGLSGDGVGGLSENPAAIGENGGSGALRPPPHDGGGLSAAGGHSTGLTGANGRPATAAEEAELERARQKLGGLW